MSSEYNQEFQNAAARHLTGDQLSRIKQQARDSETYWAIQDQKRDEQFRRDYPEDTSEPSDHS